VGENPWGKSDTRDAAGIVAGVNERRPDQLHTESRAGQSCFPSPSSSDPASHFRRTGGLVNAPSLQTALEMWSE
jgi:hypothetical protein